MPNWLDRAASLPIEIQMLGLSAILGIGHIAWWAHFSRAQHGMWWVATARDEPRPPLKGLGGRVERAFRNYLETYPFFLAATTAVLSLDRLGPLSALGAQMYFWGRVAYLALYASGVPLIRSIAWNVGAFGILVMFAALGFP